MIKMDIEFKRNQRMFICGKTGSGKTELAKRTFGECPNGIVYDIQHENKLEELGTIIHEKEKLDYTQAKIVYQPEDDSKSFFDSFCEELFYSQTNIVLYVEEVEDLAPNNAITPNFRKYIRRGRKLGLGCIMVSQLPSKVDKLCISQADHVIVFRMFEPNHIEYIAECAGLSRRQVKPIYHMEDYQFFYYSPGKEPVIMNPIDIGVTKNGEEGNDIQEEKEDKQREAKGGN